ncbi:MAG: tyrosine-type recombinase/integrase [Halobacteriovoraceae bacterium]|jgi:integrase/recombinase XerD|nr:tyrosine-type recombinase/integrase [Halobacteriovoraceae bacterium]
MKNIAKSDLESDTNIVTLLRDNLQNLIEYFLLSHDIKQNSQRVYRRALHQFLIFIIKQNISNPCRNDILNYKRYLISKKLSSYTVANYLKPVRGFFSFLEAEKIYPNIAKFIKAPKHPKMFNKDPLTRDQAIELLDSIERNTLKGKRDYALINLMIRRGLRAVEITRINIGDLRQLSGKPILYIQGKGSDQKDQFSVLSSAIVKPIFDYLAVRPNNENSQPLFGSVGDSNRHQPITTKTIRHMVKDRLIRIGINSTRISTHSLRHTAVTFCLLGDGDIQNAQLLARHSNINTTLIYAHNINHIKEPPGRFVDSFLEQTK